MGFLISTADLMQRQSYYQGQLHRHRNAKRNLALKEAWRSHMAAEMAAGSKRKAAAASANEAMQQKWGISPWQVRRILSDTAYLMDRAALKLRFLDLQRWEKDQKHILRHAERLRHYQTRFEHWFQRGRDQRYSRLRAIDDTATAFKISLGQVRRMLRLFEVPTRKSK